MIRATPANMRRFERPARTVTTPEGETIMILPLQPFAWSRETDERASATPGDYWQYRDDEPLTDSEGEPMELVFEVVRLVAADEYAGAAMPAVIA